MENLMVIYQALPYLLQGIVTTLSLVLSAMILGFIIGVPLSVGQVYGSKWVKKSIGIYVWFFRGLPILVLLFLFYYGLFSMIGLNLSAFISAVLVLGLRSSAYQTQIFRGSMQSLGQGQLLAAQSLGMSKGKAIWNIILPQALRISIPGWSNEYPAMLTESAVTYAIGVMEVLTRGNFIASRTYRPMPIYLTCALIFILLSYIGMKLLHMLEEKVRIPGFEE
ncbi:MAG: amino acid ABC transporter permease [Candidatus Caldatribacteriota bacterium]|jgi:polar amino acid transport system permease protein|nr:amino acid ABC transporter permease [Atribacterota bacterium]MDD3031129.1 amino acid ABC transporter permease [Atribacterota bacterium]MDD3640865.1 amino acid ABC transporter permease [Atribacterota bacterium]MDD4289024.1 amino acid ABC transporter permease [Atribacterota bacterium]MDD4765832.1 amino acid ABC transporter permease [Atribacterota bacterium]